MDVATGRAGETDVAVFCPTTLYRLGGYLKQGQYVPLSAEKQVATIWAATLGYVDKIPVAALARWEKEFYAFLEAKHAALLKELREKKELVPGLQEKLEAAVAEFGRLFTA